MIWPWLAAAGLGLFHGLNPGMGWLFAVSNGLQAGRGRAVWAALLPIGVGHLLAMAAVLVPAAVFESVIHNQRTLQTIAAAALIAFGLYKLARPRHPRFMARIGPKRLTLWSFLMATAHGAGLMLLPVFFEATTAGSRMHGMASNGPDNVLLALLLVAVHTLAMIGATGAVAWPVYRYLGLRLLRATWINTDQLWAVALILVGLIALIA